MLVLDDQVRGSGSGEDAAGGDDSTAGCREAAANAPVITSDGVAVAVTAVAARGSKVAPPPLQVHLKIASMKLSSNGVVGKSRLPFCAGPEVPGLLIAKGTAKGTWRIIQSVAPPWQQAWTGRHSLGHYGPNRFQRLTPVVAWPGRPK